MIRFYEVRNGKKTKTLIKEFPFPSEGYQTRLGDEFDIKEYDPFNDFEAFHNDEEE